MNPDLDLVIPPEIIGFLDQQVLEDLIELRFPLHLTSLDDIPVDWLGQSEVFAPFEGERLRSLYAFVRLD